MRLAHVPCQFRIIVSKFSYHVEWLDVFGFVVSDTLKARNLADRANGGGAYFPGSFSKGIPQSEYLVALFIQHQVIVPEMWAGHMPVKVFGFEIQRKRVREK